MMASLGASFHDSLATSVQPTFSYSASAMQRVGDFSTEIWMPWGCLSLHVLKCGNNGRDFHNGDNGEDNDDDDGDGDENHGDDGH
jgi:hypothetical protein